MRMERDRERIQCFRCILKLAIRSKSPASYDGFQTAEIPESRDVHNKLIDCFPRPR
jgi:hypothetical protein